MTWLRTEEEADIIIEDLIKRTKGAYITKGVSFNKNSPSQIELLKMVLLSSTSFSGYVKELLANNFHENTKSHGVDEKVKTESQITQTTDKENKPKRKNIGNFL